MKKITQLFIICAIAVIMAISVSAATVTLDLNAYDEANDQYMLAVNYQADGGDAAIITVKFDFNSEKLILADTSFEAIADIANAKGTPLYFPKITSGSGLNEKTAQWGIVNEETGAQWSVNGNKVSAYITAELPEAGMSIFDDATGYEAFDVLFNLADGVTVYGEPVETNLYTVAKSVSNNEIIYDALKTEVRDFIDTVVGLVENG